MGVWGSPPTTNKGDREGAQAPNRPSVGLTWHNPNTPVLAEGPEISIKPVRIRRVCASEKQ